MGAQSIPGAGVECPGQQIDDLLDMLDVHPMSTVKLLDVHAGEAEGVRGWS